MVTIRCKKCGEQINVEDGKKVVTCKACGTMQVVSLVNVSGDERKEKGSSDKRQRIEQAQKKYIEQRRHGVANGACIVATEENTYGLRSDGTVIAVGNNEYGQCNVADWRDIVAIFASEGGVVAGLRSNGTVVATGAGLFGECNVSDWQGITAISIGTRHIVGLRIDGTVVAAGDTEDGDQCKVSDWRNIVSVAAGDYYTAGLHSNGTVVVASDIDTLNQASAWTDIVAIIGTDSRLFGLKLNGNVVTVGDNDLVQKFVSEWQNIKDIAANDSHAVGLAADGMVRPAGENTMNECDVFDWWDIIDVGVGLSHTVGLRSNGTVVATGENGNGRCDVSGWRDIIAVSAGFSYTVGLRADGTVVATGCNESGQCDVSGWKLFSGDDSRKPPEQDPSSKFYEAAYDEYRQSMDDLRKATKANVSPAWEGVARSIDDTCAMMRKTQTETERLLSDGKYDKMREYWKNTVGLRNPNSSYYTNVESGYEKLPDDQKKSVQQKYDDYKREKAAFDGMWRQYEAKMAALRENGKKSWQTIGPIFTVIMLAVIHLIGWNNLFTRYLLLVALMGTEEVLAGKILEKKQIRKSQRWLLAIVGALFGAFIWRALIGFPDATASIIIGYIAWAFIAYDVGTESFSMIV